MNDGGDVRQQRNHVVVALHVRVHAPGRLAPDGHKATDVEARSSAAGAPLGMGYWHERAIGRRLVADSARLGHQSREACPTQRSHPQQGHRAGKPPEGLDR